MAILDLGKIRFQWKGSWSAASSYTANDVVSYNNAIWICTAAQGVGVGNEFSPGLRDRANANGTTLDPDKIITFDITVASVGLTSLFFLNGHRSQQITILPGFTYKFYQKDASNTGNRWALSTTIDGSNNGGTEYTTGLTASGTAGVDREVTLIHTSSSPATLYYYSPTTVGLGGLSVGRLLRGTTWRGWQYWQQVTSGLNFRGPYTTSTQYYYNDVIEYQGATYRALADISANRAPVTPTATHYWDLMIPGDRRAEEASIAWPQNAGPIGWPYPHGRSDTISSYQSVKFISMTGRVLSHGSATTGNHGISRDDSQRLQSHPNEINFNNYDWWNSRDNNKNGKLVTPDGQPPKVIQVENGYSYSACLFNNGEVWKWGYGANGERGDGDTTTTVGIPRRVIGLNDVKIVKISQGMWAQTDQHHCLALDEDGYVWAWGFNSQGQLGLGHTNNVSAATRIPRSYFGGRRVIDILAGHGNPGFSYARTSDDNLYAWGDNQSGQLGDGSLVQKNRPVLMSGWDPLANNGIRKWQVTGSGTAAQFMILDGNNFLWHTGYNANGTAVNGSASNNINLTKATATPGGSISDFWLLSMGAGTESAQQMVWIRTNTGGSYVAGRGSTTSYINGLNASVAVLLSPQLVTSVVNVRDVKLIGGNATNKCIFWLTDNGRIFFQGQNMGANPQVGTNNNANELGGANFLPIVGYQPPGMTCTNLMYFSTHVDGNNRAHGIGYLMDNGMVMGNGHHNTSAVSTPYESGMFGYNAWYSGRGAYYQIPVPITFAR